MMATFLFSGQECGWKSYERGIIQTCLGNISILGLLKFYNFPSSDQSTMLDARCPDQPQPAPQPI